MYNNYQSFKASIEKEISSQQSVLNKFPDNTARLIVQACAKYLAQFTSAQLILHSNRIDSRTSSETLTTSTSGAVLTNLSSNTQSTHSNRELFYHQSTTSITTTNSDLNGINNFIILETSEQVNWVLENLMYGLTLSHEHQDIIKDCWNVYQDWLSVLLDEPKLFLPKPIKDDAFLYSKKMLWHLYNLFVPRKEQTVPTKHSMICHHVLVLLEDIANNSKLLNNDLWENLLKFILAINNAVLAMPYNKDDFCDGMSSRLVATLFEIWLIACNKNFPSPSLWKTFQELCSNWRHHLSLVIEWNRVTYALTNRLLEMLWFNDINNDQQSILTKNRSGTSTNTDTNAAYDIHKIINSMEVDKLIQSWFRFFHIIGNPIDFSNPILISRTSEFMKCFIFHDNNKDIDDPTYLINHTCLKKLPQIFLEVIKGLSQIVDTFLGFEGGSSNNLLNNLENVKNLSSSSNNNSYYNSINSIPSNISLNSTNSTVSSNDIKNRTKSQSAQMPSPQNDTTMLRRSMYLANFSNILSSQQINESTSFYTKNSSFKHNRPNVNSLLRLVGNWLFDAAITSYIDKTQSASRKNTKVDVNEDVQQQSQQQQQNQYQSTNMNSKQLDQIPNMFTKDYLLGQAEAYGILCKIFSSCKTDEQINIEYLTKFYLVLSFGLKIPQNFHNESASSSNIMDTDNGEILTSILVNGANLFKINLQGIHILLPSFLNALDAVFKLKYGKNPIKERVMGSKSVSLIELKRQCINIFASIISLPNHYGNLTIESLTAEDPNKPKLTFYSLRQKILDVFLSAVQNELDIINLQMLFGCGRLIVGEWTGDELYRFNLSINNETSVNTVDPSLQNEKKEKASFCYKQVVSLICAPLKINSTHSTLVNHSFALSIFDALSSIATDTILNEEDTTEVLKIAITWISHYVQAQIKRPSKDHTREMHSVIVAAYHCLIVLIVEKPHLLRDKTCLQIVSSCIEIGITGVSSYPEKTSREEIKESGSILMKSEKELKPASLRVKEAAEAVLCVLMEYTDPFKNDDDDLQNKSIDEQSLLSLCGQTNIRNFKYFAINGSLIMALIEKVYSKSKIPVEERIPTVIMLLRGPFGRHAWILQSRLSPYVKKPNISAKTSGSDLKNITVNTSVVSSTTTTTTTTTDLNLSQTKSINMNSSKISQSVLIDRTKSTENLPKCETCIPTLTEIAARFVKNLDEFRALKQHQIRLENKAFEKAAKLDSEGYFTKVCAPPKPCKEFESIRILLTNLNFGAIEPTSKSSREDLTEISTLDASDAFLENLKALDTMSTRLFCNCYVFYVKSGQNDAKSIINNVNQDGINDIDFYKFLDSLGTIVDIKEHNGWTGSIDTSWKTITLKDNQKQVIKRKLNQINGIESIIYWSDISSEIVFLLPDGSKSSGMNASSSTTTSESGLGESQLNPSMTQSFMEEQKSKIPPYYANEVKLLVIWLEKMQDYDIVPMNDLIEEVLLYDTNLLSLKNAYCVAIFVHPLQNGLYRTAIWNNKNKRYFYTMPLVDGMILSSNMLGTMVKQTMLNVYRRKFESENYQPPHVRRKVKICDMIKKFNAKKTEPDYYTSLLVNSKADRKS